MAGTLSPDATGSYSPIGSYNGQTAWKHDTANFWIWYDTVAPGYYLSEELGAKVGIGDSYWFADAPPPGHLGVYMPGGIATGTATVSSQ